MGPREELQVLVMGGRVVLRFSALHKAGEEPKQSQNRTPHNTNGVKHSHKAGKLW
jgi:hypothetical protein